MSCKAHFVRRGVSKVKGATKGGRKKPLIRRQMAAGRVTTQVELPMQSPSDQRLENIWGIASAQYILHVQVWDDDGAPFQETSARGWDVIMQLLWKHRGQEYAQGCEIGPLYGRLIIVLSVEHTGDAKSFGHVKSIDQVNSC